MSNSPKKECIIVLGKSLYKDHTIALCLILRCQAAAEFYKYKKSIGKNDDVLSVIVTGTNVTKTGPTEATVMTNLLINMGVPDNVIIKDHMARTTVENAINTVSIAKHMEFTTIYLFTSNFHMPRSMMLFKCISLVSKYNVDIKHFITRSGYKRENDRSIETLLNPPKPVSDEENSWTVEYRLCAEISYTEKCALYMKNYGLESVFVDSIKNDTIQSIRELQMYIKDKEWE